MLIKDVFFIFDCTKYNRTTIQLYVHKFCCAKYNRKNPPKENGGSWISKDSFEAPIFAPAKQEPQGEVTQGVPSIHHRHKYTSNFRVSRGRSPWGPPLEGRVWEGSKCLSPCKFLQWQRSVRGKGPRTFRQPLPVVGKYRPDCS